MIVTEATAKGKRCPLMSGRGSVWLNQNCLASDCMKWRWQENHSPEEIAARKDFKMPVPDEPKGYCGA